MAVTSKEDYRLDCEDSKGCVRANGGFEAPYITRRAFITLGSSDGKCFDSLVFDSANPDAWFFKLPIDDRSGETTGESNGVKDSPIECARIEGTLTIETLSTIKDLYAAANFIDDNACDDLVLIIPSENTIGCLEYEVIGVKIACTCEGDVEIRKHKGFIFFVVSRNRGAADNSSKAIQLINITYQTDRVNMLVGLSQADLDALVTSNC